MQLSFGAPHPHFAYAAPEVLITCGHDVALVLAYTLTQAVVSIGALVRAGDALNAGVLQSTAHTAHSVMQHCQQIQDAGVHNS